MWRNIGIPRVSIRTIVASPSELIKHVRGVMWRTGWQTCAYGCAGNISRANNREWQLYFTTNWEIKSILAQFTSVYVCVCGWVINQTQSAKKRTFKPISSNKFPPSYWRFCSLPSARQPKFIITKLTTAQWTVEKWLAGGRGWGGA